MPRVTIILIVHNGAPTLRMALDSLLLQTEHNWECVVIDDASTDSTPQLLETILDPRFTVQRSSQRRGRGGARKDALELAQGRYITTLDSDDFLLPEKLKAQADLLDANSNLAAVVAGMILFDHNLEPLGLPTGYLAEGRKRIPTHPHHLRVPFGPIMFRKSLLGSVTYSDLPRSEDRDFYLRLLAGNEVLVMEEPLYACRWRMNYQDVMLGLRQNLGIYSRYLGSHPPRALALMAYTLTKMILYFVVHLLGGWRRFVQLRFLPASPHQIKEFLKARALLQPLPDTGGHPTGVK